MKTDVDTALKEIADFFIKNRRTMTGPEFQSILTKHCEGKAEIEKFVNFLETAPGQLRFKTHLRERGQPPRGVSYLKEPFIKVGERVRFIGSSRGRFADWPEGKWLEYGATGVVKEYHPEEPAVKVGGEYFEALPHYAVVRWDFGGETVIDPEDEGKRWERASKSSLLYEPEPCQIISPRYYDILGLLDSVPSTSLLLEPEVKERKIDEVLERLKDGVDAIQSSPVFREFLINLSKFHEYSIANCILILLQKPGATRVAGFVTWKQLGRYVRRGERGIAILAPCLPSRGLRCPVCGQSFTERELRTHLVEVHQRKDVSILVREAREEAVAVPTPTGFKVVNVFDVSQTEGKPLPEVAVPTLTGGFNEELFDKLMALAKSEGVKVSFEPRPELDPHVKGQYSREGGIWIRPDQPMAHQLATHLHETSHYFTEDVFHIPRADAETIAESACFIVGTNFGFDTGVSSFPYVALWSKDKKVLDKNLTTMRKVAVTIIQKLELIQAQLASRSLS